MEWRKGQFWDLLCSLYINDLSRHLVDALIQLYADDTVLYLAGADTALVNDKLLEADMNRVVHWCEAKLTINFQKTKCMTYHLVPTGKLNTHPYL